MATDSRDAAVGHGGHVSVGEPLEMVQDNHDTLGERQRRESVGDCVDGEITLGLRCGLHAAAGYITEQIEGVGDPAAGYLVERAAGDDLVEPGGERRVVPEPAQILPRC